MLGFYYRIWVDGIVKMRSMPENRDMWKFYTMFLTSLAMAFNLATALAILQRYVFKRIFWDVDVHIFHNAVVDAVTKFFLLYYFIPLVLNYFLILWNRRYETLLSRYKTYNGWLYISYTMGSLFLPLIAMVVAYWCGVK